MTEISEAAKARATEMLDADRNAYMGWQRDQWAKCEGDKVAHATLARFIQEVSDAAKMAKRTNSQHVKQSYFAPFILPEPVDPLVEVLQFNLPTIFRTQADVAEFRQVLAKRGLKIVENK